MRSFVVASTVAALVGAACGGGQGSSDRSDAGGPSDAGVNLPDGGGPTDADGGSAGKDATASDADTDTGAIASDTGTTTSCSDDLGVWSPYACKFCMDSNCCAEQSACAANATCVALIACQVHCLPTDTGCPDACVTQFPGGVTDVGGVTDCLQTSCPAACEGAGG